MRRLGRWLLALLTLAFGWMRRRDRPEREERIVAPGEGDPRAEWIVIGLLMAAAACAIGFVVVYAIDDLRGQHELLGLTIGACFAFIGAAFVVAAKRLFVTEEIEEDYPEVGHPEEAGEVAAVLEQSGTPITRKRLLAGAGATAGGAMLLAAVTPALSLGPWLDTNQLRRTPWRAGRRLVDQRGEPLAADDIEEQTFYSAFAEGASSDELGSPLVLVRIDPAKLHLPRGRVGWAPEGILAYSKICTHAGCAVSLYRKPKFAPTQPAPALICPCHYSTFDPARGADVTFGPAGRRLPQLPLRIDLAGNLRAAGNLSGPVGPSWSGVRRGKPGP